MPLYLKNNKVISSSSITSTGVFTKKINRDSLICYLDAADVDSYPGSGTTWYDLSGNGTNGTLVNGVSYNSGVAGGVLVTNGSNQYITVPCGNLTSTNYTVIGGAKYATVSGRIFSAESNNWLLGWWSNTTENYYANGWVSPVSAGAADTNWRIMAGSGNISESQYIVYVNSVATYSNQSGTAGPYNLSLGRYAPGNSEYSNAYISFLLVYNRVLNPFEISEVYQAMRGRLGI
jgi:hypothetical protein